jgi:4-amino-4-deoxy-L-arabinose transferase-like glycosyltransferase
MSAILSKTKLHDLLIAAAIFLGSFFVYSLSLGSLEFFRHTEADRSLIAWEMLQSSDFLVPTLLHSPILTKPPMFYWFIAMSHSFFGEVTEYTSRFPSAFLAAFFLSLSYLFFTTINFSKRQALVIAVAIGTAFKYMQLSVAAEIDMSYAFFSSLSLYFCFLGFKDQSLRTTLVSYVLAALAFLVKGPPIVVFYGASSLLYYIWSQKVSIFKREYPFTKYLLNNVLGAIVFLGVVLCWLIPLANHVGWAELKYQFEVEILNRFSSDTTKGRGVFFYPVSVVLDTMPYGLFLLVGVVAYIRKYLKKEVSLSETIKKIFPFSAFSMIVVFVAVFFLSLSEGKASRYWFPVYPFAIICCYYAYRSFESGKNVRLIHGCLKPFYVSVLVFGVSLFLEALGVLNVSILGIEVLNRVLSIKMETKAVFASFCLLLGVMFFICASTIRLSKIDPVQCSLDTSRGAFMFTAGIMILVHAGFGTFFVPYRNEARGIQPYVEVMHSKLDQREAVFSLESFQRWNHFYLKKLGHDIVRITPAIARSLKDSPEDVHLILDLEEEGWRLKQLAFSGFSYELVALFEDIRDPYMLIKIPAKAFVAFDPRESFPTSPTPALY